MVESKISGVIVRPSPSFVDARGSITNIAIGDFKTITLIRTLGSNWRSKHWHRTDSHILYVLEGEMQYWECPLDGTYPEEPTIVRQGEAILTGPLMVHATYFPVNTTLISMSKNPRDHESHEADLVRVGDKEGYGWPQPIAK